MITTTILDRVLSTERQRRQAARVDYGGFATPVLSERHVTPEDLPVLATSMGGQFVRPGVAADGRTRFAFFECALEQEDRVLVELQRYLLKHATGYAWGNVQGSLSDAKSFMLAHGLEPYSLVLPRDELRFICGSSDSKDRDLDTLVLTKGFVTEIEGVRVLPGPEDVALLLASPPVVGVYSRVDDRLGLFLLRVDRAVVVIR